MKSGTQIKIGCDIAKVERFKKIDSKSLSKIFYDDELKKNNLQSVAGMFAAKESCRKVFKDLGWHDIKIGKRFNGKPYLILNEKKLGKKKILSHDVSISHDGDNAIAIAVFIIKGS